MPQNQLTSNERTRLTDLECDSILQCLAASEWTGFTRDDIRMLDSVIREYRQPEPPPAWQPIETAPQGDAIVWLPDKGAVMARLCGDLWYDLTTGWLCEPPLWAPMPAGPSETKEESR